MAESSYLLLDYFGNHKNLIDFLFTTTGNLNRLTHFCFPVDASFFSFPGLFSLFFFKLQTNKRSPEDVKAIEVLLKLVALFNNLF